MLSNLNYYSRYNRIKHPQTIKSLYTLLINFDVMNFHYTIPNKEQPIDLNQIYQRQQSESQSISQPPSSHPEDHPIKETQSDIQKVQEQPEAIKLVQIVQTQSINQQSQHSAKKQSEIIQDDQKEDKGERSSFTDSLNFNQIPQSYNSQIQTINREVDTFEYAKSQIINRIHSVESEEEFKQPNILSLEEEENQNVEEQVAEIIEDVAEEDKEEEEQPEIQQQEVKEIPRVNNLDQIQETKSEEEEKQQQKISQKVETSQSFQKANERKPFKKLMASKKLNPRLVTSTILTQKQPKVEEEPPKKVNFKKLIKKGQSSENQEKQEEKTIKRTRSERVNQESKKKLLSSFFQQN